MVSEFPESLRYHPDNLGDLSINTHQMYISIIIQLDHMQNIFFTERLLRRHGHADDGDLLIASFEMVLLTLKLWTNKDRFSDTEILRNYGWLVSLCSGPGGW